MALRHGPDRMPRYRKRPIWPVCHCRPAVCLGHDRGAIHLARLRPVWSVQHWASVPSVREMPGILTARPGTMSRGIA